MNEYRVPNKYKWIVYGWTYNIYPDYELKNWLLSGQRGAPTSTRLRKEEEEKERKSYMINMIFSTASFMSAFLLFATLVYLAIPRLTWQMVSLLLISSTKINRINSENSMYFSAIEKLCSNCCLEYLTTDWLKSQVDQVSKNQTEGFIGSLIHSC